MGVFASMNEVIAFFMHGSKFIGEHLLGSPSLRLVVIRFLFDLKIEVI